MVDVMAPTFEKAEEKGSRTKRRQATTRKLSPRGSSMGATARRAQAGRRREAHSARRLDDESDSDSDSESENEGRHRKAKATTPRPVQSAVRTIAASSAPPKLLPTSSISSRPSLSSSTSVATPTSAPPQPAISTLGPLPTVSNPAVVANPQQSIPPLTIVPSGAPTFTSASSSLPVLTLGSNPRKGEDDETVTSLTSTILATAATTPLAQSSPAAAFDIAPSPTIFIDDTDDNIRDHDSHHDNGPPSGLSPTAEDVLISAGSIGAFILICFVVWIGWRTLKKPKRRSMTGGQNGDYPSQNNLFAKIPYFGRNQRGWEDLDGSVHQSTMYDAKSMQSSIYSMNDPRHVSQTQTMSSRGMPVTLPELQTNFAYSAAGHPYSSQMSSMIQPTSAQSMQSLANMQNALRTSPAQQPQQLTNLTQIQTNISPTTTASNPFASPQDRSNPSTLSPQAAAQYGNGTMGSGTMGNGTMETYESLSSDRSRMPDAYYNQSELARQASTAYDPKQRAVYRASVLSSISSGFGDGDFIIPPPPAALQPEDGDTRPISYAKSTSRSRSNSTVNMNGNGQRDTVYTTTSEDMPARYRSVNSWVNQQTGRVQRQQARDDDADVPPVPSLPAEDRYTMMMDDGEVPRRYEDTLSPQPPMPALSPRSQNNPFNDPAVRRQ